MKQLRWILVPAPNDTRPDDYAQWHREQEQLREHMAAQAKRQRRKKLN